MREVIVNNRTKSVTVGTRIGVADTALSRLVGLLGKKRLDAGCGVLLRPSSGVHTFGMAFPIDVVALDRGLKVVRVWHGLRPLRLTSINLKTSCVLELAAGQIESCCIEIGDQLELL